MWKYTWQEVQYLVVAALKRVLHDNTEDAFKKVKPDFKIRGFHDHLVFRHLADWTQSRTAQERAMLHLAFMTKSPLGYRARLLAALRALGKDSATDQVPHLQLHTAERELTQVLEVVE